MPTANSIIITEPEQEAMEVDNSRNNPPVNTEMGAVQARTEGNLSSQQDTPDVPARFVEKKRLEWAGKTCAPSVHTAYANYILKHIFRSSTFDDRWKPCMYKSENGLHTHRFV